MTKKETTIKRSVQDIVELQRKRRMIIQNRISCSNRNKANICARLTYNSYQDEKTRKAMWTKAGKIFKIIDENKDLKKLKIQIQEITQDQKITEHLMAILFIIAIAKRSISEYNKGQKVIEAEMEEAVQKLPIHEWWASERGRAGLGLAILIGEIGDLSNYDCPAKVWKRMGVAVIDGVRQGGLSKNAPAELWIEHGYVKRRRSVLHLIGDSLMKGNGASGHYKLIYNECKKKETKKLLKQWIKDGNKKETFKPGHAHNCAVRYMEKMLLKDLWNKWHKKSA